jgi:hypothetical protein
MGRLVPQGEPELYARIVAWGLPLGRAVVVANNPQPRAGSVIPAGKHDSSPRALATSQGTLQA